MVVICYVADSLVRLLRNAVEMVGGATKWQRQPEPRQRRQNGVEQRGVFDGELPRQRNCVANAG